MKDSHKILAACFSCTGQARKLAGAIAAVTGGSLAEIRPGGGQRTPAAPLSDSGWRAGTAVIGGKVGVIVPGGPSSAPGPPVFRRLFCARFRVCGKSGAAFRLTGSQML